ncbi:type II toxin-antitoxin system RelE/ParE family toxin [Tateyamaria sp. SN6-1]|uniref:type II toxin-antitoxin system RelE/ParE family toxin n=1 Tax=Tateyamaria sp. SN6-1 TaxID=3092148 RepID=UPI0039F502B3
MTRQVVLRPAAEADLIAIWTYTVETWSVGQAEAYLRDLDQMFAMLSDFPEMARLRTEFTPPVRLHAFRKHVIIYLEDETHVDVIRVVHGRANWAVMLAD